MNYSKMAECIDKLIAQKNLKLDGLNISTKMRAAITLWDLMYRNKAPWIGGEIKSAGLPAAISSEMARLITLELKSEITGSPRADKINDIYKNVLSDLRKQVEYGCAKGSLIFKPYLSGNTIAIQYNQADSFFPIAFDNSGNITQCAFTEQYTKGKEIYTRVELHSLENVGARVQNFAYMSRTGANIGTEVPLDSVTKWSDIEPNALLQGTGKLLIGFFKMPVANNIVSDSPLGTSIFSRTVGHIKIADKRYSQIDWEYDSKESAVHIASSMLKYDKVNDKFEYPGGRERLYRTIEYNTGASDKPFIDTFSPDIRDESYFHGYNQQLRRIEFDCGLAYGTLSDVQDVEKTAEEIKSSKQRSYATVSDSQRALQTALTDLVDAIDYWVTIGKLAPEGEYAISFNWDDSIITDNVMERKQDMADVAAGLMNAWEYRMKWYGEDEDTAKANVPQQADTIPDGIDIQSGRG